MSSDLREKIAGADEAPVVPLRPSEEELRNTITYRMRGDPIHMDQAVENSDLSEMKDEALVVPLRPSEENSRKEEVDVEKMKSREEDQEMITKKKVKKKKNPFMPDLSARSKLIEKKRGEDGLVGTEKKTLLEQLNEFHLARVHVQDEEDLMEWWSSVEHWEPMSRDEDMSEKEEARAFAMTAEKVRRGVRVFQQLFSERAEALWQHIIDLNLIAEGLDRFNKRTKVAQITGGSASAVGGVATIAGIALAPFTMGTSLIVTAVGLGVAAAGGLASASAGISNSVHGTLDRKKVERIVKDFQSKMADIDKCTRFIKQGAENLRELRGRKVKKLKAYDGDLCGISNIYEDGVMAGKAVLISASEITRFTEAAMVTGSTAARAVQVAAMATGILTGLFVAMDVYFVAKDSHELRKGAKSELARKIREVAEQLHGGLVELNTIREELQCSQSHASSISSPMASSFTSASMNPTSSNTSTPSSSSSLSRNPETQACPPNQAPSDTPSAPQCSSPEPAPSYSSL